MLLVILLHKFNNSHYLLDVLVNKNDFDNILPKIKLNDSRIPTKTELFKSRQLFITKSKLTKKYINYIRQINFTEEKIFKNQTYEGIEPNLMLINNRSQQMNINSFYELCLKEKLISNEYINETSNPLISILIIAYNKKDIILKSVRSIQNQSLKNIEIIIVNDCSTDDSEKLLEQLLKSDGRIRIFTHLNNMGAWRSRLDAFLYSNAPYVIHFDAGDFYADNYVLEDIYHLIDRYKLDSIRFSFRLTRAKNHLTKKDRLYLFRKKDRKIVYGTRAYSVYGFRFGTIWNRLTRANVFTKGLYLLDEYILNAYKNIYDDRWWNTMANNESYSYLMSNRIGYIYIRESNGEGHNIIFSF